MPVMNFKKDVCPSVIKVMIALEEGTNINNLSVKTRFMYSHVSNIVTLLKNKGMIFKDKQGRNVIIKLTKKGEDFQHHCKKIMQLWRTK